MPSKDRTPKSSKSNATNERAGLTAEERAALKDRLHELKGSEGRGSSTDKAEGESAVLEKIASLSEADRIMAERVHAIVKTAVPELTARTWYGMPAYAKDGNVVCFFQSAQKFKTRYATLGFSDKAKLDDGNMWPTAFALKEMTAAEELRISSLVKRAVGLS
jgi:uncharacterized protein YdhG (YjbR/CyaY superfamily)